MKLLFTITFKRGPKVIETVKAAQPVDASTITVEDIAVKVIETEQFLERLTGLRVHIGSSAVEE